MSRKRILYAVLNWGLGHATRSVPVINELIRQNYEPIIASDGIALRFLREEFPQLDFIPLPSYHIVYPAGSRLMSASLFLQGIKNIPLIRRERKLTGEIITRYNIRGIISDNRPGIFHPGIPSVYLTHQIYLAGKVNDLTAGFIHRKWMYAYDEIWIPDTYAPPFLSGKLAHANQPGKKIKFIGILSRFEPVKNNPPISYDWLIILSGPENQRSELERKIIENAGIFQGKTVVVRGTKEPSKYPFPPGWQVVNFAYSLTLKNLILQSKKLILRSGYSSIMDLVALRKKAVLIPTPGQKEQIYLARFLAHKNFFPYIEQKNINKISRISWNKYQVPDVQRMNRLDLKLFES